jgi:hypothetical protein
MKMCENFAPNFGDNRTGLLDHSNALSQTSLFTRELFFKNNMTVVPHPRYFSLFPRLKIKLKGHHFVVIEAESLAVLYTLIEHDF